MSQNPLKLDDKQKEAVEYPHDKPLLVAAGPGSGKTTVVAERVKHLINVQGVAYCDILCMTFTRAAREAMRERLRNDPALKESDRKHLMFQILYHYLLLMLLLNLY